jgi:DNA-3-methyladenine glycosylase
VNAASDQLHGALRPLAPQRLSGRADRAAIELLGVLLVRQLGHLRLVARIVETEAYREDDPASHSHRGRTPRTAPMFAAAGTAYVYRSYGLHWLLNVSVEAEGIGAAVLLRAATVLEGVAEVRERRPAARRDADLLRGPARLTVGLDVDGPRHDHLPLLTDAGPLRLADDGWEPDPVDIVAGPRVGISHAADLPWRFHLAGVDSVSPYRRSPRAPR